jgi:hypothetical protein
LNRVSQVYESGERLALGVIERRRTAKVDAQPRVESKGNPRFEGDLKRIRPRERVWYSLAVDEKDGRGVALGSAEVNRDVEERALRNGQSIGNIGIGSQKPCDLKVTARNTQVRVVHCSQDTQRPKGCICLSGRLKYGLTESLRAADERRIDRPQAASACLETIDDAVRKEISAGRCAQRGPGDG